MMTGRTALLLTLILLAAGCASRRAAPVQPAPEPEPAPSIVYAHETVWTADEHAVLHLADGRTFTPHPVTRLDVIGADSLGVRVRCTGCAAPVEAWVDTLHLVHTARTPAEAAAGTLADFALAVRAAAERRDLDALLPVMTPGFSYSLTRPASRVDAAAEWRREDLARLGRVPALLDRGLATRDGRTWTAPAEFVTDRSYRGPRTGFQRVEGRWQWMFFVPGG
jgi:hypothetical protein